MANRSTTTLPDLSPEIIQSIQSILSSSTQFQDPLDDLSQNFNVPSSLNSLFPEESTLSPTSIEAVQNKLALSRKDTQENITRLRNELGNGVSTKKEDDVVEGGERENTNDVRMGAIQEIISDLLLQTSLIREKSSESSHVVHEITKDIQLLDVAKRNLVTSIGTLRKFGMMVNGVSQLEDQIAAVPRKYPDVAQSLAAVKNLASTFKSSMRVPRIALVLKRVQELQGEIRGILEAEFDAFFLQDPSKTIKRSTISDACGVVDVLGEDFRNHLIDRYCVVELKEYRRIFRATDEAGQLDNISRRFAYFRRLLSTYDTDFSPVFPPEWKVDCALSVKWGDITREDLSAALSKAAAALSVTLLLESLQQTTDFEIFLGRKFGSSYTEMLVEIAPVLGIRNPKPMSSAFEPHMGIFIDAQDKALSDILVPHRGAKSRTSLDEVQMSISSSESENPPIRVLSSSTELFYFYAQNMDQCSKLSTKELLADMFAVWGKWLRIYSEDVLMASMKRPERERKSFDGRLNVAEIKHACLLLNTADYCQETAQELEEKVREKIDEKFRDKITLQAERDLFVSVISASIVALLKELEAAIEPALVSMQRTSWITVENVSGESAYISDLVQGVQNVVNVIRDNVEQKKYLRNFYDKASSLIITKFTNALVKSRPLKEAGAEQMLLDLQGLRSCLLKVPGPLAVEGSTYSKLITKATSWLETLLKLVIAPVDPVEGFVQNYILLVGDSSFSNFQKVLDLKGTPRVVQNNLLDSFLTITSTQEQLESASFLSSLDMDPGSSAINTTVSASGRASLPNLLSGISSSGKADATSTFASLGLTGGMTSPPPTNVDGSGKGEVKKEPSRISDFRRFVSFAVRRDTTL
ncbi:Vps53-like protein [Hysterangium stoloniferum]|nr:Vps53-like protein [Hysterangium stoloniferum]